MDNLTKKQRSLCMSKIRSRDTQPEKIVRKALRQCGWSYRLHAGRLPGRPDVVIPKSKTIIFVNGCFWHQHKGCGRRSMPKANVSYWSRKLRRNIEKQKKDIIKFKIVYSPQVKVFAFKSHKWVSERVLTNQQRAEKNTNKR